MKKILSILLMSLFSHTLLAGPVVEVFECTLNEGKTVNDANNMMSAFSDYVEEAGLSESYTAHLGFQHHPNKKNSINWIGISPSAEDFGKITAWFTGTAEGAAFGELYNSVYSCENSFLTYVTASSQ